MLSDYLEVYRQFIIDVPRICIYIDNVKCSQITPDELFCTFINKYSTTNALVFVYYCTQIFLAEFYIQKSTEIKKRNKHFQLFDCGQELLYFSNRGVYIIKPFSICFFDKNDEVCVDEQLVLEIDINVLDIMNPKIKWSSEWQII
tara:strand:+ start:1222 stop:1656 length:435 start_codon:yes stop_codon:yes gene_type:complete